MPFHRLCSSCLPIFECAGPGPMLCKQAASHTFCVPGVIYESIYKGNNSVLRRGYVKLGD